MILGFNIEKAEEKGYFVAETRADTRHEMSFIKCAGTLDDCLDYIREKFEAVRPSAIEGLKVSGKR